MIDLTVDINTEKAKRSLEGLRQSAKRVVSGMINDFELLDSAVIRFNKTLGGVGGNFHIPALSAKIKQAQNEFNKLEGVIMTPKLTEYASKEVNAFIASLEQLDKALRELPARSNSFDAIASSMRDLVAQADIFIDKIGQIQQSAVPIPNKTPTQSTPTVSNTQSSAPMMEAASYRELLGELQAVSGTKLQLVGQIEALKAKNKEYKSTVDAVNKAESDGIRISQERASQRRNAALAIEQNKVLIQSLQRELKEQIKVEQAVETSINDMTASLKRMQTVYSQLDAEQRQSPFGQNLYKNIEELEQRINGVGAAMQAQTQKVGYYASGFNGLSFQIQQVARELPSLAYGPQIFFAAISNNLPMLTDEISRARTQYNELVKSGQKATPVWKQILSSLVSWQTLIVAGVTVLTLYGKEIVNWAGSLLKGRKEIDSAKIALEQFHATMTQGTIAAQDEITKLDLLYRAATDAAKPYEERKKAVERLQEIYPAYFGNMDSEMIMAGQLKGKYDELKASIIEVAQARAAEKMMAQNSGILLLLDKTDAYEKYVTALSDAQKAEKHFNAWQKAYAGSITSTNLAPQEYTNAAKRARETKKILQSAQDSLKDALQKLGDEGKELWDRIENDFDNNAKSLYDAVSEQISKFAPVAEKLYTGTTPDEANEAAEKAMQAAERDAEKAKQLRERLNSQLEEMILKAQEAAIQAEIDLMADGTTKKLAQINLDYQKRSRAIRKSVSALQKLWLEEYKYRNAQDKDSDQYKARQQMETQFKGNVDHLARPLIDAAELVKKGWEDAGEGIATVFSSQYGILDAKGKETEILVTPILPNGDILSPQELEDYIFNQLEGAQDILKADTKGIVIATNVSTDGSAGEKYHQLQGEYYADAIEFAESLRISTQALNDANEAIRESERHEALAGKPAKIDLWKDFEEDQKAWNEYYEKYGTFRERLQATKDKYDRKLAESKTEGERASIQAEYAAALAQLEVESSNWAKELINKTIGELENIQTQLENELEAAKRTFNAFESSSDPEAQQWAARINTLESQLKVLTPQINKAKKAASDNDWAKGALALNAIADGAREALNGVRDLDEGLADALETLVNIASSAGSFASAMKDVLNGASFTNIASAVASGISLISSVIGALGLFGPSAETKQYEALVKQYSGLIDIWDQLIEKKRDYINESWGEELTNTREETLELLKMQTETSRMLAKSRLRAGASAGSHSYGYRMWKGSYKFEGQNWRDVADEISAALGTPITWIDTFADLSSEQLQWIKENYSGLWSQMDGEFRDYLENIITYGEQANEVIEQAKEQITQISFNSFESDFASLLADMDSDSKDFADNFEKYLQNAIMSSLVGNKYKEKLRALYDEWVTKAESGNELTPGEVEELRNKYKNITEAALSERDAWKDILGWEESTSGQTATSRGFQAMSQDTGDELNGRFTDMQGKMNILVSGMDMLRSINMETRNASFDIRDIAVQINGNIMSIGDLHKKALPNIQNTLNSINKKLDNL